MKKKFTGKNTRKVLEMIARFRMGSDTENSKYSKKEEERTGRI